LASAILAAMASGQDGLETAELPISQRPPALAGTVRCANLVYADGQSSKCFADHFLRVVSESTHIRTSGVFETVEMGEMNLFDYPFAVMTGEGRFVLTESQRANLRSYLNFGGFVVASAGCSCPRWGQSFRQEIAAVFPEVEMREIPPSHPLFSTVYPIEKLPSRVSLQGLEIDGRIVLVFSPDGLNDTKEAVGRCCCCGGSEIKNARQINVNLLVYALTH
jgi:hypothetical protein